MSLKLQPGILAVAIRLQEAMDAGDSLSSNDIRMRLSDALQDQFRGTGKWAYLVDSFGDATSGDVIYSCDSNTCRASYEMSGGDGAQKCIIDFAGAIDVVPRTIYEVEADEGEHLAAMESLRTEQLYGADVPLYERFITKGERDKADKSSFAGKGKSFPILKSGDVAAAAKSLGRAGTGNYSADVIRKNITRIAKEKGFESELPKSWKGDAPAKEAKLPGDAGQLKLVESAAFPVDIPLREAFTVGKKIKLIAPGPGSTAYYTESALKQAATDKIFHAGLPMRIDHPTKADEAARPEGSVKDWGAVLGSDAVWMESYLSGGKEQGPGLYSDIKPFSDHAQTINEKGPYAGVSISANGRQLTESGRGVTKNGLPVLEKFTKAEGCDMVTRAGAGGLFLQESARPAEVNKQEASMDPEELKLLRESVARLSRGEIRREAIQEGARILRDVSLPDSAKEYVISSVLKESVPEKDGALDVVKFTEAVNAEAKRFGQAIGREPAVIGMGSGAPVVQIDEAQRKQQADSQAHDDQQYRESWAALLEEKPGADGKLSLAEHAFRGRAN